MLQHLCHIYAIYRQQEDSKDQIKSMLVKSV